MEWLDSDGLTVQEGDVVSGVFGIPPRRVEFLLIEQNGALWGVTQDADPVLAKYSYIKGCLGGVHKVTDREIIRRVKNARMIRLMERGYEIT